MVLASSKGGCRVTTLSLTLTGLRAAVVRDPSDDTVRLAYADALDEEGGKSNAAHAKIIRLMIRHQREYVNGIPSAELPTAHAESNWIAKTFRRNWRTLVTCPLPRQKASEWEQKNGKLPKELDTTSTRFPLSVSIWDVSGWNGLLPQHRAPSIYCDWRFRRGFVSHVWCHWQHWERMGIELVTHEPIESVELTTWPEPTEEVFGHAVGIAHLYPPEQRAMHHRLHLNKLYPTVSQWTFPA